MNRVNLIADGILHYLEEDDKFQKDITFKYLNNHPNMIKKIVDWYCSENSVTMVGPRTDIREADPCIRCNIYHTRRYLSESGYFNEECWCNKCYYVLCRTCQYSMFGDRLSDGEVFLCSKCTGDGTFIKMGENDIRGEPCTCK